MTTPSRDARFDLSAPQRSAIEWAQAWCDEVRDTWGRDAADGDDALEDDVGAEIDAAGDELSDDAEAGAEPQRQVVVEAEGAQGFPVALRVDDGSLYVQLAGWVQRFVIEDDDDFDAARSAVDLFVAALVGELELRVVTRANVDIAWQVRLLAPSVVELPWQGARPLLSRLSPARTLRNTHLRPRARPRRAISIVPPWAPWSGAGGELAVEALSPELAAKGNLREQGLVIDGVLDLHPFRPKEVRALVDAYLDECRALGILQVRIIHGKGKGVLRRIVHSQLDKDPRVVGFRIAGDGAGQWGATIADLAPLDGGADSSR